MQRLLAILTGAAAFPRRGGIVLLLVLGLIAGSLGVLRAEGREVHFRHLLAADGLPGGAVHQIIQDSYGYLWIATQDGLSRYDGYEFVTYQNNPAEPASLPNNDVWCILEDQDGVLWVGTDGGGLSRLDVASGRFHTYRHIEDDKTSLSDDRVRVLAEDNAGNLWVGTYSGGLSRLDRRTGLFDRPLDGAPGLRTSVPDRVQDLVVTQDGQLWIATAGVGLLSYDPASGSTRQWADDETGGSVVLGSRKLKSIAETSDGALWIGTWDAGLVHFDPRTGSVVRFRHQSGDPSTLLANRVRTIFLDEDETLWIGSDRGLSELRPDSTGFTHHRHHPAQIRSLSDERVSSIFQDRGGVLWVGTSRSLDAWNTRSRAFMHEFRDSNRSTALSSNFVTSFAEGEDGTVWVGTLKGLNRYDRASGEFQRLTHREGDPRSLSDDRVMSLLVDSRGELWVGTQGGGLNRYDARRGTFTRLQHDPEVPGSLGAPGVTSLLETASGDLWAGTYGGGLNRLDRETGLFSRFGHDPSDRRSLSSSVVTSLYEDRDGALWVATERSGLNRFDPKSGLAQRFRHDPVDETSLSTDMSWFVTGDAQGNLWVGTDGGGLNRLTSENRRAGRGVFQHYSTAEGLPSSVVYAVLADDRGDIWASSIRGLSRLLVESGLMTSFGLANGLQADEFNFAAAMRAQDGEFFFGGINGFSRFRPERVLSNDHRPAIAVTRVEKLNETVVFDRPLAQVERLDLSHSDSVVTFHFAALDFTAPDKNRYAYMLEGFDDAWIDGGTRRQVTYTNLDPGEYRLLVRGSNNDGVWSEGELALRLHVAPPPWQTWWAYCFYFLIAALGVTGAFIAYTRKRRRARELELVNLSLTHEISERKAKEVALEAEKRKAREYLDVAEVIMLAIGFDGKVALINQKGCRVLGRAEEEIVGRDWVGEFVPRDHRDEVRRKLLDVGSYQYYEYPVVSGDGVERTIAWHSANLPASADDPPVILCSGADTTQVRELEKQVRFHQKMEALGTLAGGVAHDFNNILTAIFGYSTLTFGALEPQSEEAGYVANIVKACERAKDLVARILTFSRRGEHDKRAIDVGEVVSEAAELLRSSLPATIKLELSIAPDCPPVMADSTEVHQVVMNLGTNAAHAMPRGGRLEISVAMLGSGDSDADAGGTGQPPHLALTVRDTGEGMDEETLEKIFDPFFTTKEVGEGTGLGLSVVHGIVTSHGGEISVTSSPGEGTTFVVELPCTVVHEIEDRSGRAEMKGRERVLIVDDEPMICDLGERVLTSLGYEVSSQTDSESALRTILEEPSRFDLLITDNTMPDMTGLELVGRIRRQGIDIRVIVTSGRKTDDVDQAVRVSFLQKPFSVADLGSKVREVLDAATETAS